MTSKPFTVAYARCSTAKQDLDIQKAALTAAGADRIFEEKVSGASEKRPELKAALDTLQPGNVFMVHKIDRLARSSLQAETIFKQIQAKGAEFRSINEGFDTTTLGGKLLFTVVSAFAEMERGMIRERVMTGVEAAKAKGVKFGRKRADHPEKVAKLERAKALMRGGLSTSEAARAAGIGRTTVYKYLSGDFTNSSRKRTAKRTEMNGSHPQFGSA